MTKRRNRQATRSQPQRSAHPPISEPKPPDPNPVSNSNDFVSPDSRNSFAALDEDSTIVDASFHANDLPPAVVQTEICDPSRPSTTSSGIHSSVRNVDKKVNSTLATRPFSDKQEDSVLQMILDKMNSLELEIQSIKNVKPSRSCQSSHKSSNTNKIDVSTQESVNAIPHKIDTSKIPIRAKSASGLQGSNVSSDHHDNASTCSSHKQMHSRPTNANHRHQHELSNPNLSHNMFGQNIFSVIVHNATKFKYEKFQNYLNNVTITEETTQSLEVFYTHLCMALSFVFEDQHTELLPAFEQLDRNINFQEIFLDNLFGPTREKCYSVFSKIGSLLKIYLLSSTFIKSDKCPRIKTVLKANKLLNGWTILEKIFRRILVSCGGRPTTDLDALRTTLVFNNGESYIDFYIRTQNLVNEYHLRYNSLMFVPVIKITSRFIHQLNRAREYSPLLTRYIDLLEDHIDRFGDVDSRIDIGFSIADIFEYFEKMKAVEVPSSLTHTSIPHHASQPSTTKSNEVICGLAQEHDPDSGNVEALIESLSGTIIEGCSNPVMCAAVRANNRSCCQACLLGFHDEVKCFLRGPNFQPDALKRRIRIYNQIHGDKPPKGKEPVDYQPGAKSAIHQSSQNNISNTKRPFQPFRNYKTKQSIQQRANINSLALDNQEFDFDAFLEDTEPSQPNDDTNNITDTTEPTINAFLTNQVEQANKFSPIDEGNDIFEPRICSYNFTLHHQDTALIQSNTSNIEYSLQRIILQGSVIDTTPATLRNAISHVHLENDNKASKRFITQHSNSVAMLPSSSFESFGRIIFHVDGGANVSAVVDKTLFYFFIPCESNIEQVGGDTIPCNGWGGILFRFNNIVQVMAPVYYCPSNPRNTFSTTIMTNFGGCISSVVDTNKSLILSGHGISYVYPMIVQNDLDHIELEIVRFKHDNNVIASSAVQLRRSPRLHMKNNSSDDDSHEKSTTSVPSSTPISHVEDTTHQQATTTSPTTFHVYNNDKFVTIFSMSTMAHIAAFCVLLECDASPRDRRIKTMNSLLGNYYNSEEQEIDLLTPTVHAPSDNEFPSILVPIIAKFIRAEPRESSPFQEWTRMHLSLLHASPSTMDIMIQRNLLQDIPPSLKKKHRFDCFCHICALRKATKLHRGKPVDKSNLRPFERLHMDYEFFGVESIRGFSAGLNITCAATSYTMCFPTPSRSPPVILVKYIVSVLRNMGYKVIFIRVDEDGALAQSTEFCRMIQHDIKCLLETTGGGNSNNNGISERSNFTRADMMRSLLTTMHLLFGRYLPDGITINMFWCFAYCYSGHVMRRLYNRSQNDIPYYVVHKQRPSLRECVIPGSIMTIVSHKKNKLKKLDETRGIKGFFLGFSNHTSVRLYFDPANPMTIKRSTHCIIEDIGTLHALQSVVVSPLHSSLSTTVTPPEILNATKITSSFDNTVIQFPGKEIHSIKMVLPPFPTEIGLSIGDDDHFNIPLLNRVIPGSPAYRHFPPGKRRNYFIVGINAESPITSGYTIELLQSIQRSSSRVATFDIVHRGYNNNVTGIAALRATFDALPSMLLNRPMINSAFATVTQPDCFISSAVQPQKTKSYFDALKSPLRFHWKAAAFVQFLKNHNMAVFSLPFPTSELPPNAKVLRSQLVPEVKPTDMPGIYELKIRHVIVGTPERRKEDFAESYSPTVDPTTLRIHISLACGSRHVCGVIDVKNAFQNTIGTASSRKYINVPPTYLEWARSFLGFKTDYSTKYYIQMFNSNQGTKDAGNQWYNLVMSVLIDYGCVRSHIDHAYFVKDLGDGNFIYISLATDDLFVSCPSYIIFDDLVVFMKSFFDLSIQHGQVKELYKAIMPFPSIKENMSLICCATILVEKLATSKQ